MSKKQEITKFEDFSLSEPLLKAVLELGYEIPTPIQSQTIPALKQGRDIIGQAQTGTGKTAAFALPLLDMLDLGLPKVQALVLTPTRELALQVSEALHSYSKHLGRVSVLPIYGGQPYPVQLRRLSQGVHVVVGTPGRVMDHMRRGTLNLDNLKLLILDEADEMLRMGFLEDVEWILDKTPAQRQIALFTATLPERIKSIAGKFLKKPQTIEISHKTRTVPAIAQHYVNLLNGQKLDALTQLLGWEPIEAALVFTRTKNGAAELAEKLVARGISAEALHGDMNQSQREQLIKRLRARLIEVVVATDVAARGLDVEHITHVFNYDIPHDVEVYVHRIGRTGRAGRAGMAVMFITPRERAMLRAIEDYTKSRMTPLKMPTNADIAARTIAAFKESLTKTIEGEGLAAYLTMVEELAQETGLDMAEIAAAAAKLALGDKGIDVEGRDEIKNAEIPDKVEMVRIFMSAGAKAGVRASDVVGAIANEGGIAGKEIGAIDIKERHTIVEIPKYAVDKVLSKMSRTVLRGHPAGVKLAFSDTTNIKEEKKKAKKERKQEFEPKFKKPHKSKKASKKKAKGD